MLSFLVFLWQQVSKEYDIIVKNAENYSNRICHLWGMNYAAGEQAEKEFSLLMKDPYLFTHRRYEQTQSRHTKGWLLAVMTHCAYLFVSDNMLHSTLFISSYFPCG